MCETKEGVKVTEAVIQDLSTVLREKGYRTLVLNEEEEVIDYIHRIPNDGIFGLGESITTCTLKIRNLLARKGRIIFYGWNGDVNYNRSLETFEEHPLPDYFLTRINAITLKGDMLLKDYSRKAMQESRFPRKIFAFAGCNRIVDAFDDAPSLHKYSIFKRKPDHVDFTVVLLPNINY